MSEKWVQQEAIELCTQLERIAPDYGAHIALTGGLLYKLGERKDADIMVYRIRQIPEIDTAGFFVAIEDHLGIKKTGGFGWCFKAEWKGKKIDFFFPEEDGDYEEFQAAQHIIEMKENA